MNASKESQQEEDMSQIKHDQDSQEEVKSNKRGRSKSGKQSSE